MFEHLKGEAESSRAHILNRESLVHAMFSESIHSETQQSTQP